MARRTANRLYVGEIDEVSAVDRPANQHGRVAIAKREDREMPNYFDAQGNPVQLEDLQVGQVIYDDAGREFVGLGEDEAAALEAEYGDQLEDADPAGTDPSVDAREPALVGKSAGSLGQSILDDLSKAYTDEARDQVFAKALNEFSKREAALMRRVSSAENIAKALLEQREADDYLELAKNYDGVPAATNDVAGILQTVVPHLDETQRTTLDRILKSAAEAQLLGEIGHSGAGMPSEVMAQVEALAGEVVGKADVTREQAIVAVFESNPAAYDEYLAETYRR